MSDAEVYRVRGDILRKRDPANTEPATEVFLTAIAIAVAKHEKGAVLRAARALSLAEIVSIDPAAPPTPTTFSRLTGRLFVDAGIS